MTKSRLTPSAIAAIGVLTLVVSGVRVADAATHGPVLAGVVNKVVKTTTVTDSKGTPLSLKAAKGFAPLKVNSTTKVTHLNADELDGLNSDAFQRQTIANCTGGTAVASIDANGTTTCTAPPAATVKIVPIQESLATGNSGYVNVSPSTMELNTDCHAPQRGTDIEFRNDAPAGATLNWVYSDGTNMHASGVSLTFDAVGDDDFVSMLGARIEGQFIYSAAGYIVTVNIHAVDLGSGCEFTGTATIVPVPA